MSSTEINDLILYSDFISDGTKIIYMKLSKFAFNSVSCYPSIDKMAEVSGKTNRTIIRAVNELKEIGLIKIFYEKHNNYILIPPDWISERLTVEVEPLEYEAQYVKSKSEFNALVLKVTAYYNENADTQVVQKKEIRSTVKETMKDKVSRQAYSELNINEFMAYAEQKYFDLTGKKMDMDYKSGRDSKPVKELIEGCGADYTFKFITKFVESYDEVFGSRAYPTPSLRMLGWAKIFNALKRAVDEAVKNEESESSGVVF